MRVVLDFETRSSANLKDVGMYRYAEDESTVPVCLALKIDEGKPVIWLADIYDKMGVECIDNHTSRISKEDVFSVIEDADLIYAHNIGFECAMWPKFSGGRTLPLKKLRCTAAIAAVHALPRALDHVCKVLQMPIKKDFVGAKAMRRVCIGKGGVGKPHSNDPQDLIATAKYCAVDVEAEAALANFLRPMSESELAIWQLDQIINTRGVGVDLESCEALEARLTEIEYSLCHELKSLTDGQIGSGKQTGALVKWLEEAGIKTSSVDKEHIEIMLASELVKGKARRVLEIRKELALSAPAKFGKIRRCACGNRLKGLLMYHGASTGRWTGKGVQPQNLPRGNIKAGLMPTAIKSLKEDPEEIIRLLWGTPHEAGASCIRPMFVPEKGKRFLCADFSAIEARALAWLANESRTLGAFRNDEDLYILMASDIYNIPQSAVSKTQRQIGKVATLACGYQGGPVAFQKMAKNYDITIDTDTALPIVRGWRSANPNIVRFWYAVEDTVIKTAQTKKPQQIGKIYFGLRDNFLLCRLPSGRMLHYFAPKVEEYKFRGKLKTCVSIESTNSYTRKWERSKLYGGLITENIIQGLCRDVMAEAMLRVNEKYPIVLTVHDEILSEVPEGIGSLQEFCALMSRVPPWAHGCPVSVTGWEGYYYRKD